MYEDSYDSLIDYLRTFANDNDIKNKMVDMPADCPSVAYPVEREIFINDQWRPRYEVPFSIGHEIGHIMNGDRIYKCQSPAISDACELKADQYSTRLIFNYVRDADGLVYEPQQFIEAYGIPERMIDAVKKLYTESRNMNERRVNYG